MNIGDKDLQLLFRLQMVKRWQIVGMVHQQSVAEHSYRVWALVTHLWDTMFPTNHNSFERELAQRWAMLHDAAEGMSGDIPTPAKRRLEQLRPGICEQLDEAILAEFGPAILETWRGVRGSLAEMAVELCDIVEAMIELSMQQHDTRFMDIHDGLFAALEERLREAEITFPGKPWKEARQWCRKRLGYSPGLTDESTSAHSPAPPSPQHPAQPAQSPGSDSRPPHYPSAGQSSDTSGHLGCPPAGR